LRVHRFDSWDDLYPFAEAWDRLAADQPFRGWAWASAWWKHYGLRDGRPTLGRRLFVLGVFDDAHQLVAIAPWYIASHPLRGRIVRFLGTGEVCPEYLGLLVEPKRESEAIDALAQWLVQPPRRTDRWDLLDLDSMAADDAVMNRFFETLNHRKCLVVDRPGMPCWQIEMPDTWESYVAMLSKNHRRQTRAMVRKMQPPQMTVRKLSRPEEIAEAESILVDLHQKRRHGLGQPGCFASPRYKAFHHDLIPALLRRGQVTILWIETNGQPLVVEYLFHAGDRVYDYQSGWEPAMASISPGKLGMIAMLQWTLEHGYSYLDALRGGEPYKAHWRAAPRAMCEVSITPNRLFARLRLRAYVVARKAKRWLKARFHPNVSPTTAASSSCHSAAEICREPQAGESAAAAHEECVKE
jgi:CelD/BcsL family acetyltransferase involved in cellulose biosynthesis